jgi:hypothetical protein
MMSHDIKSLYLLLNFYPIDNALCLWLMLALEAAYCSQPNAFGMKNVFVRGFCWIRYVRFPARLIGARLNTKTKRTLSQELSNIRLAIVLSNSFGVALNTLAVGFIILNVFILRSPMCHEQQSTH